MNESQGFELIKSLGNSLETNAETPNDAQRNLQWTLQNKGDEIVIKAEGGIWVGYDRNGNRITPE